MTKNGSDHITITILKTTVMKLRGMKGSESWDELMLRLAGIGSGSGVECMRCKGWIESDDIDTTPRMLAKENGWTEIAVRGEGKVIGFVCPTCLSKSGTEK